MTPPIRLVSHALCPYVQRAVIVLAEKGVAFERRDVDLAAKPQWFLDVSPLAKTPVLLAGEVPIFESAVICEYLDETFEPRLHPADALERARHRAWIEFGSALLNTIGAFYSAPDETALAQRRDELVKRFGQLESELEARPGPFFAGDCFSIVDAIFGPVFRYFDVFDRFGDFGFFERTPRVLAWRCALAARPSVRDAVRADYAALLLEFIERRGSALARRAAMMQAMRGAGALQGSERRLVATRSG